MHIFVDESGTFTSSTNRNAWCVVASYVAPEHERRRIDELMAKVHSLNGGVETKLKHLTEDQYIWFLRQLGEIGGIAFAVAADLGLNSRSKVELHRNAQAAKIVEHRDKMFYEAGRRGLTKLSELLQSLPAQLYTQLVCQVELFHRTFSRSMLYFAQRHAPSLANFRWRLDQKSKVPTAYEEAFRKILPVILQTKSLDDPLLMLREADYRHFARFEYAAGEAPTYLNDVYGIPSVGGPNVGKIIGDDFQLVDSTTSLGVQIADLLAGGIRRLLRGEFQAEEDVAIFLGSNFVQPLKDENTVQLVSLDQEAPLAPNVAHLVQLMDAAARPILVPRHRG